jgi:hypothetical protein
MKTQFKLTKYKSSITNKNNSKIEKWSFVIPSLNHQTVSGCIFVATLVIAGIAIYLKIENPVVWTFLGMCIGRTALKKL